MVPQSKNYSHFFQNGSHFVNDANLWEKAQIIREKGTNRTAFRENRAHFYTWYRSWHKRRPHDQMNRPQIVKI